MNKEQAIKLLEAALDHVRAGDESIIEPLIEPLTSLDIALGGEENLRQQELYTLLINSMPDGVVMRSPTGEYLPDMTNPAARQLLDDLSVLDPFKVTIDQGLNIKVGEHNLNIKMAHVESKDHDGYLGDVFVLRDITNEVAAPYILYQFLNSIGHELPSPLAMIRAHAKMVLLGLEEGKYTFEQQIQFLNSIILDAERLTAIVHNIIRYDGLIRTSEFIQREQAKGKLLTSHYERVDLNKLVCEILDEQRVIFEEGGITLQMECEESTIFVEVLPGMLRDAIQKLLENARLYSRGASPVKVGLWLEDDTAVIRITDSGVGISEEDMPNIFKPFYQGEPIDSQGLLINVHGWGLGLYMARSIVELFNGSLELTHTEVVKGSTFTLHLPLPT